VAASQPPGPLGATSIAVNDGGALVDSHTQSPQPVGSHLTGGATLSSRGGGVTSLGRIRVNPAAGKAQSANRITDPTLVAHQGAIAGLASKSEDFKFEGRTFRIVQGAEWRGIDATQRYQVMPAAEARTLLSRMATVSAGASAQKAALERVSTLIQDSSSKPMEKRLLLLRRVPTRAGTTSSGAAAITPSQLRKMLLKDDHWIEIELVDEAGDPVADVAYVITTPDGNEQTGRTNAEGSARVSDITAGQCKIRFPELDKDAWSAAS